jgi:hypothetical protein
MKAIWAGWSCIHLMVNFYIIDLLNVSEGLNQITLAPDMINENIIIVKISSKKENYSKVILRY